MLKGQNPAVVARASAYRSQFGHYTLSTVTIMEIVAGFHKHGREDRVQQILAALGREEVLALDFASAVLAGRIYADLERTGQPIGRADPMIAGIAVRHGLVLVTGNTAHFQRIQGCGYDLNLDNWRI